MNFWLPANSGVSSCVRRTDLLPRIKAHPPQVVESLLWFHTAPGDPVVDLFGGRFMLAVATADNESSNPMWGIMTIVALARGLMFLGRVMS